MDNYVNEGNVADNELDMKLKKSKNKKKLVIPIISIILIMIAVVLIVFLKGEHDKEVEGTTNTSPSETEPVVDFQAVYDACKLKDTFASIGSDGSYLSIDTNPDNKDDYTDYDAYLALSEVAEYLGLPYSLMEDMLHTSASDGKQSETFEDLGITVSWKYHPDKGLEATYKISY